MSSTLAPSTTDVCRGREEIGCFSFEYSAIAEMDRSWSVYGPFAMISNLQHTTLSCLLPSSPGGQGTWMVKETSFG